jgi:hypothetical protein
MPWRATGAPNALRRGKTVWFELELEVASAAVDPRPEAGELQGPAHGGGGPSEHELTVVGGESMVLRHQHRDPTRIEVRDLVEMQHDPAGDALQGRPQLGRRRQVDLTRGRHGGGALHPMNVDVQRFLHRDLRARVPWGGNTDTTGGISANEEFLVAVWGLQVVVAPVDNSR